MRIFYIILLIGSLLLTGCSNASVQPTEPISADTVQPTESIPADTVQSAPDESLQATEPVPEMDDAAYASLVSLRQGLIETPQCFAVAYFGYVIPDAGMAADPYAFMADVAPQLCQDLPFLLQIPQGNCIGTEGHLFCVVPRDEQATVAVNWTPWDEATETYGEAIVLYRSETGNPFLLMTTNTAWCWETEVFITDSRGAVTVWYPFLGDDSRIAPLCDDAGNSLYQDFSPCDQPNSENLMGGVSEELAGTWELAWTEVEGDRNEAAPGVCTIEITAEGEEFRISYNDSNFPEDNFTERELIVSPGELYPGCGNNQWIADVSAASDDQIHYAVTLLDDGMLLMQQSWEMDGMPMVSYSWYRRIS